MADKSKAAAVEPQPIRIEITVTPAGQLDLRGPDLHEYRAVYDFVRNELGRMLALEFAKRAQLNRGLVVVPPGQGIVPGGGQ